MFHLRSHLGDLGDDTATTALSVSPAPDPAPVTAPAPSPGPTFSLQHLLIIGGIAALVIYLLSRSKK